MTIEREEDILAEKIKEGATILEESRKLKTQHDHLVLRKANKALDHKECVKHIKLCHEELLEAEIRLIEALSDVESLEEHNLEIVQRLAEEQRLVKEAEQQAAAAKAVAEKALVVVKAILSEVEPDSQEYLTKLPAEMTVESLEIEIAAEESKLDYIHANNPNAIRDFEKRQQEVEKLKEKIADTEEKLERSSRKITKIRSNWEPQLDALVSEISDAFAFNFEQIGCAGEVSVHKDDDFDQWAIQIKVRFRYYLSPFYAAMKNTDPALQRGRSASDPRRASPVRWREICIDHFLSHVLTIPCTCTLPCRRRNQPRHGQTQ
jgi:chromosome segregation ATPase